MRAHLILDLKVLRQRDRAIYRPALVLVMLSALSLGVFACGGGDGGGPAPIGPTPTVQLVKDINPGPNSSLPTALLAESLFFAADDGITGRSFGNPMARKPGAPPNL